MGQRATKLGFVLETVTTILVAAVALTLLWNFYVNRRTSIGQTPNAAKAARPGPVLPETPVSIDSASLKGDQSAPVVLLEFSDFQCPFCSKFARETLPELDRQYIQSGKVLFAFMQMPIAEIHPLAAKAAESAECAAAAGAFWPMHDRLFITPPDLGPDGLAKSAAAIGLNPVDFATCMDGRMTDGVRADVVQGKALGVQGTPTFFLGARTADGRVALTRSLVGALPYSEFTTAIEESLKTKVVGR